MTTPVVFEFERGHISSPWQRFMISPGHDRTRDIAAGLMDIPGESIIDINPLQSSSKGEELGYIVPDVLDVVFKSPRALLERELFKRAKLMNRLFPFTGSMPVIHLPYGRHQLTEHAEALMQESPETEKKYLYLGKNKKDNSPVRLPTEILKKHVVCLGSTGSGKTVFCKHICEEALQKGIHVVAIDTQGDLASMAMTVTREEALKKGLDIKKWEYLSNMVEPVVFTPGSDSGIPLCVNPFSSLSSRDFTDPIRFEQTVNLLAEILADHLKGLPRTALPFFKAAIVKLIKYALEKGTLQDTRDLANLMSDIPMDLANDLEKVIKQGDLELLNRSFQVLVDSPARYLFDYGVPLDIDLFAGRTMNPEGKTRLSILYLNTLESSKDREYFVSMFLDQLYTWMLKNPSAEDKDPQLLLFIDEIGEYVPPVNQVKPACKDILIRLFKQARKYGIGCLFASQSPGDFDYRALGQANTVNIGRLKTEQDRTKVLQMLPEIPSENMALCFNSLTPGEFYLGAPDIYAEPVLYQAPLPFSGLSTLVEGDLPPLITPELRNRFSDFFNNRLKRKVHDDSRIDQELASRQETQKPDATAGVAHENDLSHKTDEAISFKELPLLENHDVPQNKKSLDEHIIEVLEKADKAIDSGEIEYHLARIFNLMDENPPCSTTVLKTLKNMRAAKKIKIVNDGNKRMFHLLGEEYLPEAGLFSKVLYPKMLHVLEAEAEKIMCGFMEGLITGKRVKKIRHMELYNYPVWRVKADCIVKPFWKREEETFEKCFYVDAMKGMLLEKNRWGRIIFSSRLSGRLEGEDNLFRRREFVKKSPGIMGLFPEVYHEFSDSKDAGRIVEKKYPVSVKETTLMFLPFWGGILEYTGKAKDQVRCIDALFGYDLKPSKLPGFQLNRSQN